MKLHTLALLLIGTALFFSSIFSHSWRTSSLGAAGVGVGLTEIQVCAPGNAGCVSSKLMDFGQMGISQAQFFIGASSATFYLSLIAALVIIAGVAMYISAGLRQFLVMGIVSLPIAGICGVVTIFSWSGPSDFVIGWGAWLFFAGEAGLGLGLIALQQDDDSSTAIRGDTVLGSLAFDASSPRMGSAGARGARVGHVSAAMDARAESAAALAKRWRDYDDRADTNADQSHPALRTGEQLVAVNRFRDAAVAYGEAALDQAVRSLAMYKKGECHSKLLELEAALSCYDAALRGPAPIHDAWYARGIALAHLGRLTEAKYALEQFIRLAEAGPRRSQAQHWLDLYRNTRRVQNKGTR